MKFLVFLYILSFYTYYNCCCYDSNTKEEVVNNVAKEPSVVPATANAEVHPDRHRLTRQYEYNPFGNCHDDVACMTMASHDRLGLEAIRALHSQLDDDENGAVDLSESDDFLREELKYDSDYERRQKAFHYNDDKHISVRELWEAWLRSEVHNWTVEETSEWLAVNVGLPQYIPTFLQHQVTGATLPRLAVNNMHYMGNVLGIKDPIHKQKIALKAMDVVLFGPPKEIHKWKDFLLMALLISAVGVCYYTYQQHKNSKNHLARMMRDMESLQKAELTLEELQRELERARLEQESVTNEKQNLERKLQEASSDVNIHTTFTDLEVTQLKAEIEMLRSELQRAEGELEDRCWSAPISLQHWLQLTYELENKTYLKKKVAAEKQLQLAREACEKLRKKRTSLVGAFVSTHGKSIDDVDRSIVEARTSLNEVTQELQERVYRWKQIELLCGFSIVNNNGLQYLESILYNRNNANGRVASYLKKGMSSSQDDLADDETMSVHATQTGFMNPSSWQEESSGSENDASERQSVNNNVQFIVGGDSSTAIAEENTQAKAASVANPKRSNSNNNFLPDNPTAGTSLVRSHSQDMMDLAHQQLVPNLTKSSQSESCLDHEEKTLAIIAQTQSSRTMGANLLRARLSRESSRQEDDIGSTDSSIVSEDEVKKRRRKLHFPAFSRKSRVKE